MRNKHFFYSFGMAKAQGAKSLSRRLSIKWVEPRKIIQYLTDFCLSCVKKEECDLIALGEIVKVA